LLLVQEEPGEARGIKAQQMVLHPLLTPQPLLPMVHLVKQGVLVEQELVETEALAVIAASIAAAVAVALGAILVTAALQTATHHKPLPVVAAVAAGAQA
jgi:hypothetical protein